MFLTGKEKLEFIETSVTWIEGRDIIDSCFALNFGYDAPLPWPQASTIKRGLWGVQKGAWSYFLGKLHLKHAAQSSFAKRSSLLQSSNVSKGASQKISLMNEFEIERSRL